MLTARAHAPLPLKPVSTVLLRLLLCASLVLNGIGSAAAGTWTPLVSGSGAAAEIGGHGATDCAHTGAISQSLSTSDGAHTHQEDAGKDCLKLCIEKCMQLGHALPVPHTQLSALNHRAALGPLNVHRTPSPDPGLLIRPPIV